MSSPVTADTGSEAVLIALADPTRRRILDMLAAAGGLSATAVAQELPVSRQAVVKHLAVLDHAELVSSARSGREVRYTVRTIALERAARWFEELTVRWSSPAARGHGEDVHLVRHAAPRNEGASADVAHPSDGSGAVAAGVRVAGQLADFAYRLVPRPLTAIVRPVLRR
jgi:DNA-binding transcriptional ArsR family regulator